MSGTPCGSELANHVSILGNLIFRLGFSAVAELTVSLFSVVFGRTAAQQYSYLDGFRTVLEVLPGENSA